MLIVNTKSVPYAELTTDLEFFSQISCRLEHSTKICLLLMEVCRVTRWHNVTQEYIYTVISYVLSDNDQHEAS